MMSSLSLQEKSHHHVLSLVFSLYKDLLSLSLNYAPKSSNATGTLSFYLPPSLA